MLNQKLKVDVYGLSLAEIEGRRFAAVYIGQPALGDDAKNNKGIVIMKMPAEPKVFDETDIPSFPYPCDVEIRLTRAGQGKMGQRVTHIAPAQNVKTAPAVKS